VRTVLTITYENWTTISVIFKQSDSLTYRFRYESDRFIYFAKPTYVPKIRRFSQRMKYKDKIL